MPVDLCVFVLPVLVIAFAIVAVLKRHQKVWRCIAVGLFTLFALAYVLPGCELWLKARKGNRDAQYELGEYFWGRFGNNWPDIESRDKWWLEAAKKGHPEAMYKVGYYSQYGSSQFIPKDLTAARKWLTAAKQAGHPAASDVLSKLEMEPITRQ